MPSPDVPAWITVTEGSAPILLVAPHGGRRHDVRIPGKHKVNDLLTADVTRALAAACGASTIVNEHMDRNLLDLNRLSQVRREAPWLIALLDDMLSAMVARAGHATVLVVHGWNISQAACDVGVGLREEVDGLASVRPKASTVSAAFVAERLRPLQAAAAIDGIAVTIGSRYPAAHPNNLLELFRIDPEPDEPGPVPALRRAGTIEAAQLELAIPLRWPGPRRDRLIALLAATFSGVSSPLPHVADPPPSATRLRVASGRVTQRRGIQFVADDILVMASVDASDVAPIAGRLVVSRDAERLALFTGELADPRIPWQIPPLVVEPMAAGNMRVTYDGPLVGFPSHTPFVDLERGLAGSSLIEARLDVVFRPTPHGAIDHGQEVFGEVTGELVVDGRRTLIATRGVATEGPTSAARELPSCRVTLPESPWGTVALATHAAVPLMHDDGRWTGTLHGTTWRAEGGIATSAGAELRLDANANRLALVGGATNVPSLDASLERLIPIRRPGREGTIVETTFALVRVRGTCAGWIELSRTCDGESPP